MNIGFDAKRYFHNNTGLGNYSRTLVGGLAHFYPEHEYFLFNPKPSKRHQKPSFKNVHEVLPDGPLSKRIPALWRSNWVKKDIKKGGIELYHGLSHEIPVGIHKTSVKSVVTIHDLIFERFPTQYKKMDAFIYRRKILYACAHANRIIAISEQTKTDLIDFYKIEPVKIEVCYQSCHPAYKEKIQTGEIQAIRNSLHLPQHFFLYVGSIIQRKNLLTICKALYQLSGDVQIPLVVIGNGKEYKQQVKKFVDGKNLQKWVIFLSDNPLFSSLQTPQTMAAIYQMATAMIYPSFFEGFGIPVLEALSAGLPVITSNLSCLPETGGNAALYVNPASSDELAAAIKRIWTDEDLRFEMIEKGRAQAQKFSLQNSSAAVMNVYKNVLK